VTSLAEADAMIRPEAGVERSRVHARGTLLVADADQARTPLLAAVLDRGLVVSTSRCGDFRAALALLGDPRHALRSRLGEALFRNVLPAERLAEAFARAAVGGTKVVVTHPDGLW
jgi:hypothetical protein